MAGKPGASTWHAAGGDFLIARHVMQAQRRAGASFDEAFAMAMKRVSADDRKALELTRGAWECAYHRRPFHSGQALSLLAANSDEHYDLVRMAV